jgi:hypothetical protein
MNAVGAFEEPLMRSLSNSPVRPERAKRVEGHVALLAVGVALLAIACGARNPNFCEGPDCDAPDARVDAPPVTCSATGPDPACPAATPVCESGECTGLCAADSDCTGRPASEAVCHMASGACVQCDENNTQATPGQPEDECPAPQMAVCDGDMHTCRACESNSECFSKVCDAGRCIPTTDVIYMSANGADSGTCNNPAPGQGCLTMHFAKGQISGTRKYILMEPSATAYDTRNNDAIVEFNGAAESAYIVGIGATLRRIGGNVDGHIVEVKSGASVTIEGLTLSNATGAAGHGILCSTSSTLDLRAVTINGNAGAGISSTDCTLRATRTVINANMGLGIAATNGSLQLTRSTISNNVAGGVSLSSGGFNIVNNFIVSNGNITTSLFGGLQVSSAATTNALEFNTIALNASQAATVDGVTCTNNGLVARNNIIIGLATKPRVNPGTNCVHRYTLFTPDNGVTDEGNMTILDQTMYNFTSATDFHIGAGSVAAGKAQSTNLAGETLFDVDGNARVLNGTTVDVGADEIP